MEASTPKKGKVLKVVLLVLLAVLVFAIAAAVWFFKTHAKVDGAFYTLDTTEFVATNPEFQDFDKLNELPELQHLDLTGLDLTPAGFERIAAALTVEPEILWNVPFGAALLPSDTTHLDITPDTPADALPLMSYFPRLESVQADYPLGEPLIAMVEAMRERPDVRFTCHTRVYGLDIDSGTEALALNDMPIDELDSLRLALRAVPGIARVEMKDCGIGDEEMCALRDEFPDTEFTWNFHVYGCTIPTDAVPETLVLNDMPLEELDSLRFALRALPGITRVEMKECGISNEEMGALRDEFPDTKFVWNIHVYRYTVPTDALSYSTLVGDPSYYYADQEFNDIFRYCTDLVALDLGHHSITDLSEIVHLQKLKYLILYENKITDISPLAELPELNFIELGENMVTDVTPLSKLEHLEDLNLNINYYLENVRSLADCKSMKRLYIGNCLVSAADAAYLRENLPEDCFFTHTAPRGVNNTWRDSEKADAIRTAFTNWQYVTGYDSWEEITYQEGVEIKVPPRRTIPAGRIPRRMTGFGPRLFV